MFKGNIVNLWLLDAELRKRVMQVFLQVTDIFKNGFREATYRQIFSNSILIYHE